MNILTLLQAKDPDLLNLRKSARAALVAVPVFALMKVDLDTGPMATYAFFACFVALVYANFGGPRLSRALAYIAMIAICNVLIVVGALLSDTSVAATIAMFAIIFIVSFSAIFGGYTPSFMAPVALSFSLSVLDPINATAIDVRVIGWTIGGMTAMAAALLLWPVNRRPILRRSLAEACAGIATALDAINDSEAAEAGYRRAADALVKVRRQAGMPLRPVGPAARDIGLIHAIEHVEQAIDLTRRVLDNYDPTQPPSTLYAACAHSFRRSAAVLREETDPKTGAQDMPRLQNALLAEVGATDKAIAEDKPENPDGVAEAELARVRRSFPILALSRNAMWVDVTTAAALGGAQSAQPSETVLERKMVTDRPAETLRRIHAIVSGALVLDGVIFRNAVRAAAALSLAIIVARFVPVEHGFWIMLAALVVLHSSAASTSVTALQAIAGTLMGFILAACILFLFQANTFALWVLLPICVFLSAYTPGVVNFLVGQVAFNAMVVVLFTLIDPAGITTAVLRIETVALGAACGGIMAFILWPRGARVALASAVASVYRVSADAIRTLGSASEAHFLKASSDLYAIRRHAEEAFATALTERGQRIDIPVWLALFRAPNMAHSLVAGLWDPPSAWLAENCGNAVSATFDHRDRVAEAFERVASQLDPNGPVRTGTKAHVSDPVPELIACINHARSLGIHKIDDARLLIALNEWLSYIDEYMTAAEPQLNRVVRVSQPGAWLQWSLAKRH